MTSRIDDVSAAGIYVIIIYTYIIITFDIL